MMPSRQPDLFQDDVQTDLFGEDSPTPVYRADPDAVRQELHKGTSNNDEFFVGLLAVAAGR
jgi:hypothetical protein